MNASGAGGMFVKSSSAFAVAVVAAVLAACGASVSQGPLAIGGLSTGGASGSKAGGSPATPDKMEGNPFVDGASALAPREVIASPTLAEVMQPAGDLSEMSLGRADAPVTVIKYASMTCPFCRQFQMESFPELKRQYIATGKVRFILREFPIGFQSGLATIATRCVAPARYFQAYDRLMRMQAQWVSQDVRPEPIVKAMGDLGLTADKLEACRQDKALVASLDAVKQRGRLLGIVGTPNYFINGRLIKHTLTLNDMRAIVDPLLAGNAAVAQKS